MAKFFPHRVSNEDTHTYYKVVVSGVPFCFTDSVDAVTFAEPYNANVFEVTDTIFKRPTKEYKRTAHLSARTTNYNPRYFVDGSIEDILKSVLDCYNDGNVREIIIRF